jgi:hypothetical protein
MGFNLQYESYLLLTIAQGPPKGECVVAAQILLDYCNVGFDA